MTPETQDLIKTLAWPVAVTISALLVFFIIKRGGISSLTAGKDGISLQLVEARQSREYFMNRRINQIDNDLRAAIMSKTRDFKKPILRAVSGTPLCSAALRAIAADLRSSMYQAVDDNDFKKNLSTAHRDKYLASKLKAMKDEYLDLTEEAGLDPCTIGPSAVIKYPPWDEVAPGMIDALASWGQWIAAAVIEACREKIEVYSEYRPEFEASKDEKFIKIIDGCIAKNTGYIQALGGEL